MIMIKKYKKIINNSPYIIMIFGIGLSFINNFGWDLVQTDNLTYLTSLFSGGLGLLIRNTLNNPDKVKKIIKTLSVLLEELEDDDSDKDNDGKVVSDDLVRCTGEMCKLD